MFNLQNNDYTADVSIHELELELNRRDGVP